MTGPVSNKSIRQRGALSNTVGRFEGHVREAVDDGWPGADETLPPLRTEVREERPRSAITYNKSPDLPFDRSVNPYRGCEHGCVYCFARPSHAYLGLSPGLDFETKLVARPGIAEVLRSELSRRSYRVATLAMGTNTDPYQPIETGYGLTRKCLEVLAETRHPVAIVTKGALIERDLDILAQMARDGLVRVGISVTTLDADLCRKMEPRAPQPARRIETIRRLTAAGVPVRIMASPLVPGLTDHEMEAILAEGQKAGAVAGSWIMLRLPREVADLFEEWARHNVPARAEGILAKLRDMHGGKLYDARWQHRMRGEGVYAEMMSHRFKVAARRLGLKRELPALTQHLFCPPHIDSRQARLI